MKVRTLESVDGLLVDYVETSDYYYWYGKFISHYYTKSSTSIFYVEK